MNATGITVKRGDTHDISWTVNADLTGATVRLLLRLDNAQADVIVAEATVTGAAIGEVTHTLTGTLAVGEYDVEIELTRSGAVTTAPTVGFGRLRVVADLG
jgi:hypothetical protein